MTFNRNHSYNVLLVRTDPKAGTTATLRVGVESPDSATAKKMAEAKAPGYSARFAPNRVRGT
jgi:hypothetical protein